LNWHASMTRLALYSYVQVLLTHSTSFVVIPRLPHNGSSSPSVFTPIQGFPMQGCPWIALSSLCHSSATGWRFSPWSLCFFSSLPSITDDSGQLRRQYAHGISPHTTSAHGLCILHCFCSRLHSTLHPLFFCYCAPAEICNCFASYLSTQCTFLYLLGLAQPGTCHEASYQYPTGQNPAHFLLIPINPTGVIPPAKTHKLAQGSCHSAIIPQLLLGDLCNLPTTAVERPATGTVSKQTWHHPSHD
jgi:hypothetical protein